ncbi:alpha/beta hydrolase domain-containing protein [Vibrio sp. DNB22_17_1]|uniref:alpha/beta hydrolase domain-containing protein n=1 Tax=unclassified Vibrio TaxID=2614977 RepID=UPI00406A56D3
MKRSTLMKYAVCLCYALTFSVYANSPFSNIDINETNLVDKPYFQISADFSSDFVRPDGSQGYFTVPITALVPRGKCNNTAIIDVVNSVLFEFPITPLGYTPLNFAQLFLGEDIISGRSTGQSFTYFGIQWNKNVIDHISNGYMERGTDGYIVLQAFSEAIRKGKLTKHLPSIRACKIHQTIGFGWSQTGKLLADMLTMELNGKPSDPIFDGLFLGVAGGICRSLQDADFPWLYRDCTEPPKKHVPTVAFNTQSEIELSLGRGALRQPSESLTIYDYAGLAHIDANFLPFDILFGGLGLDFKQNPISVVPAVRASFWNLYLQVKHGVTPAKSRLMHSSPVHAAPVSFLDLRNDATAMSWSGGDIYTADENGDGNADRGIRLPHMSTTFEQSLLTSVGGPLGKYGGIDFTYAGGGGIFFANGGTFEPFSSEELAQRYPNKEDYVNKVRSAVIYLVLNRYLLAEDGVQLVEEAESLSMSHWD